MSRRLAERLRTETRLLHAAAERSALMGTLMRGELDRAVYCALLRNLHAIYAALEPALQHHAQRPEVAPLLLPGLVRRPALEQDLSTLHGPRWADELALHPAAVAYVARLRELDSTQPALLPAHTYVRYLGDLSGGQMLRRVVARIESPAGKSATSFYEFGDAAQTLALTQAFCDGLGSVATDAAHEDALVDEVGRAYEAHRQLFEQLMAGDTPVEAAAPAAAGDQVGSISPS